MYTYIYMYMYIYIHIHIHVFIYNIYMCMYIYIHICVRVLCVCRCSPSHLSDQKISQSNTNARFQGVYNISIAISVVEHDYHDSSNQCGV